MGGRGVRGNSYEQARQRWLMLERNPATAGKYRLVNRGGGL